MEPWVAQWADALQDCVQEDAPYDPSAYDEYLRWYAPQTRTGWCMSSTLPLLAYQHRPTRTLYTSRGTCTSRYVLS